MLHKKKYLLIFILILFLASHSIFCYKDIFNSKQKCDQRIGCKLDVSSDPLVFHSQNVQNLLNLYELSPKTDIQTGLRQKVALEAQYLSKINTNINKPNKDIGKRRRLVSNGNKYFQIQQGNFLQVTMYDYVISLRGLILTIHTVGDPKLTKVYSETYPPNSYYPQAIHASSGYFAVILTKLGTQMTTLIKVYKLQNSQLTQLREYRKRGYYVSSRQYNAYMLILIQDYIESPNMTYTWDISDKGTFNETIFQGSGANTSSNYLGSYSRIFAKIPLGPIQNINYRFATYLFCDYSWDFVLSPQLNIFVFSNYYGLNATKNYQFVSFQHFLFNDQKGKVWGQSRWVIYPGVLYSPYELQQYNGYLRFVTNLGYGQWATIQGVSVAKLPISTFNPIDGQIYKNLGISQQTFNFARWRKAEVFIIFYDGTIETFSSQIENVTQIFKPNQFITMLYPYGLTYMIGIGYSLDYKQVVISIFELNTRKLIEKQSLTLLNSNTTQNPFSFTTTGWPGAKNIQIDWKNKRITLPIYTTENQPYKSGYIQIYVNPFENCMSFLPIHKPCSNQQAESAPLIANVMKHWDHKQNYDYNTGVSEGISVSTTLGLFGKQILITASQCQIQSRILVDPTMPLTGNSTIVWYQDLCA